MACLELISNIDDQSNIYKDEKALKIMVFSEGTILGPRNIFQHFNHALYVPIKNSVSIINSWEQQGAEIMYLTSRKKGKHVQEMKEILLRNHFSGQYLYYRGKQQRYKDIVELVMPDILIEDDCKSIGGKWQIAITYVKPEVKNKVKSIIVKEFRGIDYLPSLLLDLINFR